MHHSDFTQFKGIAGQTSNIIGLCYISETLGIDIVIHKFYIVPQLGSPVIIGTDFMIMHKSVLDFGADTVKCNKSTQGIQFCNNSVEHGVFLCIPAIPQPLSRTVLPVKCDLNDANGDVLLEPVYTENSLDIGAKCSDGEPRGTALVSRRLETAMCYLGLGLRDVY